MNITKIIFLIAVTLFLTSCIDEDKLKQDDGYYVETYFIKGHFNHDPIFHSEYLEIYNSYSLTDFYAIYNEDNPFYNSTNVDTFSLNINFSLPQPPINNINIKSVNMSNFNNKTFYFHHPMLNNQEPIFDYVLQKTNSYIKIDTVIFPDETFAFPRVIGELYLIAEKDSKIDTLSIEEFELPFNQSY